MYITPAQRTYRYTPPNAAKAIADVARRQHGVVHAHQLRGCGLSSSTITRWLASGRLYRIHPSVYALGHPMLSCEGTWSAAVLAGGDGAALSHLAAATSWKMSRFPVVRPSILVPRRHRPIDGVDVRHTVTLRPRDVVVHRGSAATTPARTMLDLGDTLTKFQLANVMHEAAYRRRLNQRHIAEMIAIGRGRRACVVLAEALELHRRGCVGTRSPAEDAYLDLVHRAMLLEPRLIEPLVNERAEVAGGSIEVDFHWPHLRLCVEVDGSQHVNPQGRRDDPERDRLLRGAGRHVIRVTARDVFESGPELVRRHLELA